MSSDSFTLCESPLWNLNTTWYTDNPDFTPCFHQTVLVYLPVIFLVALSPVELYVIRKNRSTGSPWNSLAKLRIFLTSSLLLLSIIELGLAAANQADVNSIGAVVKLAGFGLSLCFCILNKRVGRTDSAILFLFWSLEAVTSSVSFASVVRFGDASGQVTNYQLFCVAFGATVANFFLHFWADPPSGYINIEDQSENPSPELTSSFPNRLTFTWFDVMIRRGWKNPITKDSLYDIKPEDASRNVVPQWDKNWQKQVNKNLGKESRPPTSILLPLFHTFKLTYLNASLVSLAVTLLTQISPQFLNLMIGFVDSGEEQWKGYIYLFLLVGLNMVITLLNSIYFRQQQLIGMRIKSALTSAIYRKSLKLTSSARNEMSVGQTVNLMSIDTQRLNDVISSLNLLWSSPLTIILCIYSLWGYLGPSALAGLAVMILLIPANAVLSSKMKKLQRANMNNKDKRIKAMNEILDGIKVIKLSAWEPSFLKQIGDIRADEVETLKKRSYLGALQTFLFNSAPFLVAIASFATFVLIDPNNILDAQIAFVSLSFFNIMRRPLNQLPSFVIQLVQAQVSLDRINKFLNAKELNPNNVTHYDEGDTVISMRNATMTWDDDQKPTLTNIHLKVKKGDLVAVVGQVGSGKSSLLSAMTGDMQKAGLNADINVCGSVAYVPQEAWMQNAKLQYNITFGRQYNKKMYDKVVDACALGPDLEILVGGDQIEIGEKGINLSGGQKQRVSLARSVYSNGDVYLLDDPLSAVDSHVGHHLFNKVIGPTGLLKNKTRVLVTHGVKYLPVVDKIVVMKNGEISEVGTYRQLLDEGRDFADFLVQYIQEEEEKILDPQDLETLGEVKHELEIKMGTKKLEKEIEKVRKRTSQSGHSNISGFTMGLVDTEVRHRGGARMNGLMAKDVADEENTENKSLVDEKKKLIHRKPGLGNKQNTTMKNEHAERGRKGKLMQDEKMETKSVDNTVYYFYFRAVGLIAVLVIFVMCVLTQVFSIGTNVWLSAWSDDPDSAEPNKRNMYLGVYGALGAASAITIGATSAITAVGGLQASSKLHNKMLDGVLRATMAFFDTTPKGRIVNRFAKDIDYIDGTIPMTYGALLRLGFQVLGTIAVISVTNPIFILIILILSFGYWFVQKLYVTTSRQIRRLESNTRSPIYSHFQETISGISTVRAYRLQQRFTKESEDKVDLNQTFVEANITANRWLSIRLEMLGNVIVLFASLFAVLGRDTLDPGMVGLSLSYAMQITQSLNLLIRQTSLIENNMVSVERIMEYQSGLPQEAAWERDDDPKVEEWPLHGKIKMEGFMSRYREGLELTLKGVNLDIAPGEHVGIVGRTGAGKSTLSMVLFRMIEAAGGSIQIDDINIAQIGIGTLRSRITIIPQDPVLFSGSLRLNLDPFSTHNSSSLWKALELAHLKPYVSSLPAGLDHQVTEGGANLSVGQRQLLCLARALLRKTKILVMDEATAAVDLETDDLIQTTIREEFKSCTVLTIAHRLNTIMDSHKVVVMSQGKVLECDNPQTLLKNHDSAFYKMVKDAGLV